jgi:Protein of unknown function (DUF732)
MKLKMGAVVLAALSVLLAPRCHADEQAFLNDLQSQGVVMLPGAELEAGYHACSDLRAGASPDAASHYGYWVNQMNGTSRKIVDAVQRDLCSDTLK